MIGLRHLLSRLTQQSGAAGLQHKQNSTFKVWLGYIKRLQIGAGASKQAGFCQKNNASGGSASE
jgi:hypothetical protein